MAARFSDSQWQKINALFQKSANDFGLPKRRNDSVIVGSFNIRKLGNVKKRSDQSWQFLKNSLARFDLIAVQEIMDDLSGLEHLLSLLGSNYGLVVSDVTGTKPGGRGNAERLGFIFNWKKIERTALASDITYDRSVIAKNLFENRSLFSRAWTKHKKALEEREIKVAEKKAQGKRGPAKPPIQLPKFLSFIRQPHCVSFRIKSKKNTQPFEFLVINAHLLYGKDKKEREWEFLALLEWITLRAKYTDKLYHPNILLLGDCNLDFDRVPTMRTEIDSFIKGLNKSVLKSKKAATANFPMLSEHPTNGVIRTALRQKQTYDQIGIFSNDSRLPTPKENLKAGNKVGEYDYGVFNIANLLSQALHGKNIDEVTTKQQKNIYKRAEFDISDHMPIWMRLKNPY